jgi:ABC-type branched-subunit amino acid transport system substrate-binding protein
LAANFTKQFRTVFGLKPSWRDMMGYDAVVSIAIGLAHSDGMRNSLQTTLHNPGFVIPDGSSGPIKFSISGDRLVTPSIAQVVCQDIPCKFALIPENVPKQAAKPNPQIAP